MSECGQRANFNLCVFVFHIGACQNETLLGLLHRASGCDKSGFIFSITSPIIANQ